LLAQAAVFGLYAIGLLAVPGRASAFWPWPVDDFHARLYSVAFLTPALGALLLARAAAWDEVLTLGLTQVVGGLLSILGLVIIHAGGSPVDWAAPGTWLWIGMFAVLELAGIGLVQATRRLPRLTSRFNEAGSVMSSRYFALLVGASFTAAGLAGFLPIFTPPPPAGAPHLALSLSYGYLLGLFPVNALHSLFHLTIGILGVVAYRNTATARFYSRGFAVTLAALTVMGVVPFLDTTLGLAPLFGHDVWLHGVEAVAASYVGFVMPGEPEMRAAATGQAQASGA
jgi:hypothetical protein